MKARATSVKKEASTVNTKETGSAEMHPTIDFPKEKENVMPGHYAIRITAGPDTQVDLSINGSSWQTCRFGAGYYWYDWWPAPGKFNLSARAKSKNGDWLTSDERRGTVVSPAKN